MANAYAKGQEEMLRDVVNQIKLSSTDDAVYLLYEFGTGAYENGFRVGRKVGKEMS